MISTICPFVTDVPLRVKKKKRLTSISVDSKGVFAGTTNKLSLFVVSICQASSQWGFNTLYVDVKFWARHNFAVSNGIEVDTSLPFTKFAISFLHAKRNRHTVKKVIKVSRIFFFIVHGSNFVLLFK